VLANEGWSLSSVSGASVGTRLSKWENEGESTHPAATCSTFNTFIGLAT
jgi:hypothetical protein